MTVFLFIDFYYITESGRGEEDGEGKGKEIKLKIIRQKCAESSPPAFFIKSEGNLIICRYTFLSKF